jgi:hypothetical protein
MREEAEPGTCTGCVFPADAIVTVGCVHEHVTRLPLCASRIEDLRASAGHMGCRPCMDAGEANAPMITVDWPNGTREVVQQAGDIRPDEAGAFFGYS